MGGTSTGFAYDHENRRVKVYNGTVSKSYPNRLYNVSGPTTTIHIFDDQNQLIATIEGNGSASYDPKLWTGPEVKGGVSW